MQRRTLLKLGVASAAVLAVAGGGLAMSNPGLIEGRLSPAARTVFRTVGGAILDGTLPVTPAAHAQALDGLVQRIDALTLVLPPHAQGELSQLLALLGAAPGRLVVAGLSVDWPRATLAQTQQALQSMRMSAVSLRQQAYHALHDIVSGAYFSDPQTWAQLGYPGPVSV